MDIQKYVPIKTIRFSSRKYGTSSRELPHAMRWIVFESSILLTPQQDDRKIIWAYKKHIMRGKWRNCDCNLHKLIVRKREWGHSVKAFESPLEFEFDRPFNASSNIRLTIFANGASSSFHDHPFSFASYTLQLTNEGKFLGKFVQIPQKNCQITLYSRRMKLSKWTCSHSQSFSSLAHRSWSSNLIVWTPVPEEKKTVKRKKGENERRTGEREEEENIYMKKVIP